MYAIIEDSGTQFKVSPGDVIKVDIRRGKEQPKAIEFDRVLLVGGDKAQVGAPYVKGAKVSAEVVSEEAGKKMYVFRAFRRRKNVRRKIGHRQPYLRVKVTDIQA